MRKEREREGAYRIASIKITVSNVFTISKTSGWFS